jgi:hypothetical protein
MKQIELVKVPHDCKVGDDCPQIAPNITEDCFFMENGKVVGFYLSKMPERACKLADLANYELRSKRVPKSEMRRARNDGFDEAAGVYKYKDEVLQYSTILGSCPPKPHMRRAYPTISSVHNIASAQNFVKAMLALAIESEKIIKQYMPEQHEQQAKIFEKIDPQWRFGNLFTSSISNYNISAAYHRDAGNIVGAVNVIICKKQDAVGGDLNIPDYGATIGQQDNSILVYPAYKNLHGVTPIEPTRAGGYRNSLVFYPLKAFLPSE